MAIMSILITVMLFYLQTDIYIIVLTNPDGRLYIEKHLNYCWRGTSNGVDLNRNFDWRYGDRGSSVKKTDEEYRGVHPFSGNILIYTNTLGHK